MPAFPSPNPAPPSASAQKIPVSGAVIVTTPQALEIIRGCRGLDLVGCDLVEVAPIYDVSGMTAHIAADLVYEMLCVLPGVQYRN